MKYRSLESFRNDFRRLPAEHQHMFLGVLRDFFLPAVGAGSFSGAPPWPKRLRIHRLSNTEIYSLTWNFASPDGRATCHLDKMDDGEPVLVWRRIGDRGAGPITYSDVPPVALPVISALFAGNLIARAAG